MTQQTIQVSTTPPLPGLQLVQQVNGALSTIATDFAGDSDPAALAGPHMTWADTANLLLKRRNAANTAWITVSNLYPRALTDDLIAGTNDDKFATPAGLKSGFSASFTANGHIKLPSWLGDFQICWGNPTTTSSGGIAVSFSRAFTAIMATVATVNAAGVYPLSVMTSASNTTGTFYIVNTGTGGGHSGALWFIAFGKG
ncbi:hypothetical protein [Bordetella genomosp. 9]|uniref:hypothetical protein n=1 Tax=Bordetella genomosp. 9 TaxID=1416803 RepID=UPI0018E05DB8|nr:hypothetical protein [Bordetella genomosp. 9]